MTNSFVQTICHQNIIFSVRCILPYSCEFTINPSQKKNICPDARVHTMLCPTISSFRSFMPLNLSVVCHIKFHTACGYVWERKMYKRTCILCAKKLKDLWKCSWLNKREWFIKSWSPSWNVNRFVSRHYSQKSRWTCKLYTWK